MLVVGTHPVLLDNIRELTSIGRCLELQLVRIDDPQMPRLILFTSRGKRLRFFSVLNDAVAGLRTYRYGI